MTASPAGSLSSDQIRATMVAVSKRVLPLVVIGYVMAYMDRINISYAQLGMGTELGITAAAYGLVAGIFFIAYFLFEVPSNILLRKFGSRVWLARIMISWGIVTIATAFVHDVTTVLICRFLLGVAEAGFYPGIILYFTFWFPQRYRSVALGVLVLAQPGSSLIGGVTAGLILDHADWMGLSSWRWVMLLPGVVTVLVGFITLAMLPESPDKVSWLNTNQKLWLATTLETEQGPPASHGLRDQLAALKNRNVLHLAAIHFAICTGGWGFSFFLPLIIQQINPSYSDTSIGFASALPFLVAMVGTMYFAYVATRGREQKKYVLQTVVVTIVGLFVVMLFTQHSAIAMVGLCLTSIGVYAYGPPFFNMTTLSVSRTQAAVGIAAVNAIGNLGGFAGPYLVGLGSDDGPTTGMIVTIVSLVFAIALLLIWRTPAIQPGVEKLPDGAAEIPVSGQEA